MTRASAGWRCAPTGDTAATSSSSCACRHGRSASVADLVPDLDVRAGDPRLAGRAARRSLIFTVGHVGNNEAVAAAIGRLGLPDQRGGRRLVASRAVRAPAPPARGLGRPDHRRGATCARSTACSGAARCWACSIDWGYRQRRHPRPPVRRLDDAAGRAGDAGRETGAPILPVAIRRRPDDRFAVAWGEPIDVPTSATRPSSSGRPRRSPTRSSREHRGRARCSGTASSRSGPRPRRRPPTSSAGRADAGRSARPRAGPGVRAARRRRRHGGRRGRDGRRRLVTASAAPAGAVAHRGLVARLPSPRGPADGRPPRRPAGSGTGSRPSARPRPAATSGASRIAARGIGSGEPDGPGGRHRPAGPRAARPVRLPPPRPLLPRGRPDAGAPPGRRRCSASTSRRPSVVARGVRARATPSSSSACTSARSSCRRSTSPRGSAAAVAPMETVDDPALQALVHPDARRGRRPPRRPARGSPRAHRPPSARRRRSASSATATSPAAACRSPLFGAPARLPLGPALLALESGAPTYVVAVRRVGARPLRRARRGGGRPGRGHAPRAGRRAR